ncbi:M4 family metallopeptidase [Nocardioides hwasunensis]|uniref:Neutral metalloproteinase n=1 Tax=Nocardioides hwasunensis TaxID=397258 RepID=A0ABR8MFU1_9ACTN|nr:M4 family metallopeptidase [Nocardioides hwasunensis]MBD3913349.1 M4 family metallopeptidase [Nocardioides hwasunensis]
MRRTAGLAAFAVAAATAAALPLTTASSAQGAPTAAPASARSGDTSGLKGREVALASEALATLQARPGAARAADGQTFVARTTLTDADGSTHVRFDRTIDGLRVVGGDLVVHRDADDAFAGVSQTLAKPLTLGTEASVAEAAAQRTVLSRNARTTTVRGDDEAEAGELVVDATGVTPRLAWEVVTGGVQADGTPSRLATYVDAKTGLVIRSEQQVVNVDGRGETLYSGSVPLQVSGSGSSYTLEDASRGGTYTTDMRNAEDTVLCQVLQIGCSAGTTITSTSTTFGDGTNADRATAGADAQYGSNETWDYFKDVHGRDGIWGDGRGSFNRVHYGNGYVNAFWDGSKMTYGDGDGLDFGPLVSLDVAGHEMSHGVTENSADLTYSGESGGLNEATSDIFGSMVEFYADNPSDPADYLIGEQFDLKDHAGFRRMDQPSADGTSLDCWSPSAKDVDVHYSSGIGNHFFYLLAEGSGAKTIGGVAHSSTTCDGSTVAGIGREAAGDIWYRALTVYMTSGTTYAGARTATLDAAEDLFGEGSTQHDAVAAAWSAVSVA